MKRTLVGMRIGIVGAGGGAEEDGDTTRHSTQLLKRKTDEEMEDIFGAESVRIASNVLAQIRGHHRHPSDQSAVQHHLSLPVRLFLLLDLLLISSMRFFISSRYHL